MCETGDQRDVETGSDFFMDDGTEVDGQMDAISPRPNADHR